MVIVSHDAYFLLAAKWIVWQTEKDYIPYYGFKDYIKAEYGFTYVKAETSKSVVCNIVNEQKFTMFLLGG